MNLPLGTRVRESCPMCRETVTGIITTKGVAGFACQKCKHEWDLKMTESKGKGSRFTAEELKALLEKNKHVKMK